MSGGQSRGYNPNGMGPVAEPYAGAVPSQADPTYPRGTIGQPSAVEDKASQLSQEWKRGEDVVGPEPVEAYRFFSGVLSGASAISGRLSMEVEPDLWIVRLMPQSTLMLTTISFPNGEQVVIPVISTGQRLVFKPSGRWIALTNDAGLATNVYYVVAGVQGDTLTRFDWL